MNYSSIKGILKNYISIVATLILSFFISRGAVHLLTLPSLAHEENFKLLPTFLAIIIVLALGFIAYELAKPTVIPSFVLAIFFGFVARDVLVLITQNPLALSILTTIGATFILFGGGLDIPFSRFKTLVGPILSIAFIGTLISAFVFSMTFEYMASWMHIAVPVGAMILVGSALASTDPAAIIPSLKSLFFPNPRIKEIAISESAINDVVGALLTGFFFAAFAEGHGSTQSILNVYGSLFTSDNLLNILRIIGVGAGVGYVGFFILKMWSTWKERLASEGEADSAFFLGVPLLCYAAASALGGNGFLAVFVAGLLFQLRSHFEHVEHFFNHTIEGFMKPLIFMLLGSMVNLHDLLSVAPLGIVMGLLFMFVMRPFVVFVTLGWFTFGKYKFSLKELLFLSFVRETGVIPAVLLVAIRLANVEGATTVVAVGMWVILLTLIVQPPLTPWIAKKLRIAKSMPSFPSQKHAGPIAVLCSRGYSFLDRLEEVAEWALQRNLQNVTLLHCPEGKYSEDFLQKVKEVAEVRFQSINEKLLEQGKKELNFEFVGRPGRLEDNIESMIGSSNVAIVFVGAKMLDYRQEKIKKLQAPFLFLH